jgi:hypothetical protein
MPEAFLYHCVKSPPFTEPRPVYKVPPRNRVVSQMNPIHTLLTYFFENCCNVILYNPFTGIIISEALMRRKMTVYCGLGRVWPSHSLSVLFQGMRIKGKVKVTFI